MLSFFTSIPNRVTSFVSRHKYKLAFTSVCVGGAYYYYRETIWQMIEVYRLMKQMEQENLANDVQDRQRADDGLNRILVTGDETSNKHMQNFRIQVLIEMYGVDLGQVQERLKNCSTEEKEGLFNELHMLTYSRLITCIVFFHLIRLLARIEVCLIGRSNRRTRSPEDEDERRADHRELLSALRVVSSRETIEKVDAISRSVTERVFMDKKIFPTETVKIDRLVSVVEEMVTEVVVESRGTGWSWLLGSLGTKASSNMSSIVSETLDILESPQFTQLVKFSSRNDAKEAVMRAVAASGSPKTNVKAALLIPAIRNEPENIFCVEGPYNERFVNSDAIGEFCQSVYFAETATEDSSSSSSSSDNTTPAELEAKLGHLLEKLVKTDIEKK